jgi:uncharacterized integral membrane protein
MSLRSAGLLVVCLVIAVFVAANWQAITVPADINLLLTHIQAPLGLILLGLMALLCALFAAFAAWLQGTALLETRRHARELSAQRELADSAEASRITELRGVVEQEITRLSAVMENQSREVLARVDRAESSLREHPADAPGSAQAASITALSRDLHARIDRLEMGLREEMKGRG